MFVWYEIDGCFLGEFVCKRVLVGDDYVWFEKVLVEVELFVKFFYFNFVFYWYVWFEDY